MKETQPEVSAILLAADAQPDESTIGAASTPSDRVKRLTAFYDPIDHELRAALSSLHVEIQRQGVLGSWTVIGEPKVLAELQGPEGPLQRVAVHVVDDERFYAI